MSKIGFPGSPSNGREHNWTGRRRRRKFTFNSSGNRWNIVSGRRTNTGPIIDNAVDVTEFNDATGLVKGFRGIAKTVPAFDNLPTGTDDPPIELKKGDFYFVTGANELYMWTGDNVDGPAATSATADFSSTTLAYTLDNPNAYGTSADDRFGYSVAMSSNYAIVGSPYEDDAGGLTSGKAYVFDVSDGSLTYTLDNPNAYGTSADDFFGLSVSISDTYAIVGARQEDDASGTSSGKAYIFNLSDGSLAYTLDNPNADSTSADDQFGWSVAISDTYAIVGARYEDDAGGLSSGKAYVFDVSDGSLTYTLDNPNAYGTSADDRFGLSVAISSNYTIVGAYFEDDAGGTSSGKAYIFNLSDGSLAHTLDNPNAYGTSVSDWFGISVAISDTYAIVGAYNEDDAGGSGSGKAYVFDVSDGSLTYTLDNPNPYDTSLGDFFGRAVAISGNYAIVGADTENDAGGIESGKAYIYDLSDGSLVSTLDNPNAYSTSAEDQFGRGVAISGNYAIVGAYREDDAGGSASGKAYIFQGSA